MPLVGGFEFLELVLYGKIELAQQNYDLNQLEDSVSMIWTNESAPLCYLPDLREGAERGQ